ncbi:MAG TPA: hypothetical protein VND64_25930 [Pirellulales bacterium]|nr:hypothetical protein [Pirellulales bacterium]
MPSPEVHALWYYYGMETERKIDVATLDAPHRRALEDVIGCELGIRQQLINSVIEVAAGPDDAARPAQTLEDWTNVYVGLSDTEIEAIDKVAKTRANFTRNLP